MGKFNYTYDREYVPNNSTALKWIRYDTESRILYVCTPRGAMYKYLDVAEHVFNVIHEYGSAGVWWNDVRKMRFVSVSLAPSASFELVEFSDDKTAPENPEDYKAVVEFTSPVEFTVEGQDVVEALKSLETLMDNAGFKGKYKVKEVKKV